MSTDSDRIAVPTNGRGPHPITETVAAPTEVAGTPGDPAGPGSPVPFTPTQLAIGAGVIASLVLLLLGRARRRESDD